MLDTRRATRRQRPLVKTDDRPVVSILTTWHPEPADNGAKQRIQGIVRELSRAFRVVIVSLLPTDEVRDDLPRVPDVVAQYALPLPAFNPGTLRSKAALLGAVPRSLIATWSPETAHEIGKIVERHTSRIAIGADLRTLRYLLALPPDVVRILDEPNVSPFIAGESQGNWHRQPRHALRAWKYGKLLRKCQSRIDAFVVPSTHEAHALREFSDDIEPYRLENAVLTLPEPPWSPVDCRRMLYTGSLTYQPNMEAATTFAQHILPAITSEEPRAEFVVTGRLPAQVPAVLTQPNVRLTGMVSSLDELMRSSSVFVVPLHSGTGTRIKILESLAYGMPVVSTSKGVEGLPVRDGTHLLIADTYDEFAAATLRLQSDHDLASRLGEEGRRLVAERFTWEARGPALRALVTDLLNAKRLREG